MRNWLIGILLLCSNVALAQTITHEETTAPVQVAAGELTRVRNLALAAWPGLAAGIESVCFTRGTGALDPTKVYTVVRGRRVLTDAQAWAALQAGNPVEPDRTVEEVTTPTEVTGATNLTNLSNLAASMWSGAVADVLEMCFFKELIAGTPTFFGRLRGRIVMTQAQAIAALNSGKRVKPLR